MRLCKPVLCGAEKFESAIHGRLFTGGCRAVSSLEIGLGMCARCSQIFDAAEAGVAGGRVVPSPRWNVSTEVVDVVLEAFESIGNEGSVFRRSGRSLSESSLGGAERHLPPARRKSRSQFL